MKKIFLISLILFSFSASWVCAEDSSQITAEQFAEITQTLRGVLESSRKLADRNEETNARVKDLEKQFQDVQKASLNHSQDIEAIKKEQAQLQKENQRFKNIIKDFKAQLDGALELSPQEKSSLDQDYSQMKVSEKVGLAKKKAVDLEQNTANIYDQMAEEAFDAGQYQLAIEYYQKYLELNPDSNKAYQINLRIKEAQSKMSRL